MNIKIQQIDGKWFVVVNSIGGKFQEDVTDTIDMYIRTEVGRRLEGMEDEEKARMRTAIDGCISALRSYVCPVG